jgi:hypothetical protein
MQSFLLYIDRKFILGDSLYCDLFSILVSIIFGSLFLLKDFRWETVWVGVVYFPIMFYLLFWFDFLFVGVVFGATM